MAGGNSLRLADVVGGNVQAAVETLAVEPAARIAGRLDYTSPREAIIPADTVVGGVQYRQAEQQQPRGETRGCCCSASLVWPG